MFLFLLYFGLIDLSYIPILLRKLSHRINGCCLSSSCIFVYLIIYYLLSYIPILLRKLSYRINGCCLSSSGILVYSIIYYLLSYIPILFKKGHIGLTVVVFLPLVFLFIRLYIIFCHISQFF